MTPNTVLVIENESTTVTIVERSLQNEGYTMYSAVDADTGLQTAKEVTPSLILLNLAVEGANGLEICKTIHSEESLKDVPLVLLTLREGKFDPIYTKLYGIVNFLKKPFTPDQLMENVREFAPFQAGAGAPSPQPVATPPVMEEEMEEEQEDSFAYVEEEDQEPVYGNIDEPMEPASAFGSIDEPMAEMAESAMDDDVYSLDEDVSLEDAQAGLESGEDIQGGFSSESFQQSMQMTPDDDLSTDNDDNFQMLGDTELEAPSTDMGEMEEPAQGLQEDSFELPDKDVAPSPMQSAPAEAEIPDGPGLSLDGMGFDEPSEPIEPIEFEMPVEEEEPTPPKRTRAAAPAQKGKGPKAPQGKTARATKRRPTSSINRPKRRGSLVLLLVLILVLALGGGASYYFFIYKPGKPSQTAKTPAPKPAPQKPATQQPKPVPPAPTPSPTQGNVPPPAGVTPAPKPVPAPAVQPPVPAPAPTPKPAVAPKPAPPKVPALTQTTTPKPPPPRPAAPAQTAQAPGNVPAGAKYAVQFGVFSTEKNAQQLVDRLHRKGLTTYIKPRKVSTGKFFFYVLLEGGFKTIDAAKAKAHQIKISKGFEATVHTL